MQCSSCGDTMAVAFSCKVRGDGRAAFALDVPLLATASLTTSGIAEHLAPHVLSIAHWDRILEGELTLRARVSIGVGSWAVLTDVRQEREGINDKKSSSAYLVCALGSALWLERGGVERCVVAIGSFLAEARARLEYGHHVLRHDARERVDRFLVIGACAVGVHGRPRAT